MGLQLVSSEKDGRFVVQVDQESFEVSKADRDKGDVRTSKDLQEKMKASRGKELPVLVSYFKDVDGNEYVITGELPSPMPNEEQGKV